MMLASATAAAVPVKDTIVAIYRLLGTLLKHEEIFVLENLEVLDLSARVRIVAAFLDDLAGLDKFKSIQLAKCDLSECLIDLKASLERLRTLAKTYSEAFFASWRHGTALQACLNTVHTLSERLKQRLNRLITLLPMQASFK